MEYSLRCRLADGTWQDGFCRRETLDGGLTAVFADTEAETALDPELGASIAIDDSDWEQFMADDRYCEFWCRPAFGTRGAEIPKEEISAPWARG